MPTQTQKLTVDQFAQSIKEKYPAYQNVDNATLAQKMLAKYPQYADRVNMTAASSPNQSFLKKAENFATNALPVAGSVVGAIGGAALGGLAGIESGPGAVATAYLGGVAGSAAGGAAGEAAKEKLQGQALSPKNIATQGAVQGGLQAVGGPIASAVGKTLEATGAGIAKMFIPKSEAEAGMLQAYKAGNSFLSRVAGVLGMGSKKAPNTAASTAFQKGLIGTESMLGVQAKRAQSKLWSNLIAPALNQSKQKVNIPDFLKSTVDRIIKETADPTQQNAYLKALAAVEEDFKGVTDVSMAQLQKYKQGWDEFVPEKAYKGESIAGSLNNVRKMLADEARQTIYKAVPDNVKQAYLDYGNLYGITKLGQHAMTGVTNIIKGGTGTSIKNIFEHLTIPIGTIGGQTLYKVGQIGEFAGPAGVKTLGALLGIPSTPQSPSTTGVPALQMQQSATTPQISQ